MSKKSMPKIKNMQRALSIIKEEQAKEKNEYETLLFNIFIETGVVLPLPQKKLSSCINVCKSEKIGSGIHLQTVRKLFSPKNKRRNIKI